MTSSSFTTAAELKAIVEAYYTSHGIDEQEEGPVLAIDGIFTDRSEAADEYISVGLAGTSDIHGDWIKLLTNDGYFIWRKPISKCWIVLEHTLG